LKELFAYSKRLQLDFHIPESYTPDWKAEIIGYLRQMIGGE
jgi:hypothetical protein